MGGSCERSGAVAIGEDPARKSGILLQSRHIVSRCNETKNRHTRGTCADGTEKRKASGPTQLTSPHRGGNARLRCELRFYSLSVSLHVSRPSYVARSYGRRIIDEWTTFTSIAHACTHPRSEWCSEGAGPCNNMRRRSSVSPGKPSARRSECSEMLLTAGESYFGTGAWFRGREVVRFLVRCVSYR